MSVPDHREQIAAMARLYGRQRPGAGELANALPDLADGLHAQLCAPYVASSASSAEQVACGLEGVKRHVLLLAGAVRAETSIVPPDEKRPAGGPGAAGTEDWTLQGHDSAAGEGRQGDAHGEVGGRGE